LIIVRSCNFSSTLYLSSSQRTIFVSHSSGSICVTSHWQTSLPFEGRISRNRYLPMLRHVYLTKRWQAIRRKGIASPASLGRSCKILYPIKSKPKIYHFRTLHLSSIKQKLSSNLPSYFFGLQSRTFGKSTFPSRSLWSSTLIFCLGSFFIVRKLEFIFSKKYLSFVVGR